MIAQQTQPSFSDAARQNFIASEGKAFLIADWNASLFLHFEVSAEELARVMPFELDHWNGRAFVSLVAFSMERMRLGRFSKWGEWLCQPIGAHEFLNVRTYVRHSGDSGICFLTEWLPNRLSVFLGPHVYSLPYRHARIQYQHATTVMSGRVRDARNAFAYEALLGDEDFDTCEPDSLDEFLLERYVAFNCGNDGQSRRMFRVWHEPWAQVRALARVIDDSLLRSRFSWWSEAQLVGVNFSRGVREVWMGRPRKL